MRSTPKDRREPALMHLTKALDQFAEERYAAALPHLREAKNLAPRSSTVREMLGLVGLSHRKVGGGPPRAAHLSQDHRGHHPHARRDGLPPRNGQEGGRDQDLGSNPGPRDVTDRFPRGQRGLCLFPPRRGQAREAWTIIKPGRLVASPSPGELRRWFVAARVALAAGDKDAARRLLAALDEQEPDFEGVDELRAALSDRRNLSDRRPGESVTVIGTSNRPHFPAMR